MHLGESKVQNHTLWCLVVMKSCNAICSPPCNCVNSMGSRLLNTCNTDLVTVDKICIFTESEEHLAAHKLL